MCTICGCSPDLSALPGHGDAPRTGGNSREPMHGHMIPVRPDHLSAQPNAPKHDTGSHSHAVLDYGSGVAHAHAPGLSQGRMVQIEQDILGKNAAFAQENRRFLTTNGIHAINLMSGPGAGKTSLLIKTIEALRGRASIAVIEGDQQTSLDAERIRASGAAAMQINTGKGCHLDAHMVGHAIEYLQPRHGTVLMIENVGNLVCPAAFDLGEAHAVVLLSVTEGEDKPLKYPDIFRAADMMLITKCDLLPHVEFDPARAMEFARRVNPRLRMLCVSARTGAGIAEWAGWVEAGLRIAAAPDAPGHVSDATDASGTAIRHE